MQLRCFEADHELLILALHEHRIDVAVGYADLFGTAGVHVMQLWDEHLYVALPEGHVFAKRHSLTWNEFANQTVVVRGWTAPPCAYKELARRLPTNRLSPITMCRRIQSSGSSQLTSDSRSSRQAPVQRIRV